MCHAHRRVVGGVDSLAPRGDITGVLKCASTGSLLKYSTARTGNRVTASWYSDDMRSQRRETEFFATWARPDFSHSINSRMSDSFETRSSTCETEASLAQARLYRTVHACTVPYAR